MWLIATQLRSEVEAQTQEGVELVICDRGLPDILAYHEMATGTVEPWLAALAEGWLPSYDYVFVAAPDPARPMSPDELRVEDMAFRADVQRVIERYVMAAGASYEVLPDELQARRDVVGSWFSRQRVL